MRLRRKSTVHPTAPAKVSAHSVRSGRCAAEKSSAAPTTATAGGASRYGGAAAPQSNVQANPFMGSAANGSPMAATNPMELIVMQQQQAKQEAEEAGIDFGTMVRESPCVLSYGMVVCVRISIDPLGLTTY